MNNNNNNSYLNSIPKVYYKNKLSVTLSLIINLPG
jgi:hypothetical protein